MEMGMCTIYSSIKHKLACKELFIVSQRGKKSNPLLV